MIPLRDEAYAAWEAILHRLEVDLDRSAWVLGGRLPDEAAAWSEPVGAPPIPPDLLPRARDLLARQQHLREALGDALVETLERRRAASPRQTAAHAPSRPAYLDVHA